MVTPAPVPGRRRSTRPDRTAPAEARLRDNHVTGAPRPPAARINGRRDRHTTPPTGDTPRTCTAPPAAMPSVQQSAATAPADRWTRFHQVAGTLAALGTLAVIVLTWLSLQQVDNEHALTREGQATDRYNATVGNIGDDSLGCAWAASTPCSASCRTPPRPARHRQRPVHLHPQPRLQAQENPSEAPGPGQRCPGRADRAHHPRPQPRRNSHRQPARRDPDRRGPGGCETITPASRPPQQTPYGTRGTPPGACQLLQRTSRDATADGDRGPGQRRPIPPPGRGSPNCRRYGDAALCADSTGCCGSGA